MACLVAEDAFCYQVRAPTERLDRKTSSDILVSYSNEWSPTDPYPLTRTFDLWSDLIPPFIFDNVLDQLIMPKLLKAVADWTPPRSDGVALHVIVLPWLPLVGLRMEGLLDDAKRKLRSMMRGWSVGEGVPEGLVVWKDVSLISPHSFPFDRTKLTLNVAHRRSSNQKNGTTSS